MYYFLALLLCFYYSLIFPGVRLGADSQFSDFLDGLGPAQLVGRQTLATPAMGKSIFLLPLKQISCLKMYCLRAGLSRPYLIKQFLKIVLFFTHSVSIYKLCVVI